MPYGRSVPFENHASDPQRSARRLPPVYAQPWPARAWRSPWEVQEDGAFRFSLEYRHVAWVSDDIRPELGFRGSHRCDRWPADGFPHQRPAFSHLCSCRCFPQPPTRGRGSWSSPERPAGPCARSSSTVIVLEVASSF